MSRGGEDRLWRFMLPQEFELKPNDQVVLLREVDISKTGEFAPPKDFAVSGSICAPGVSEKQWESNLCVIVAVGARVHEMEGWKSEDGKPRLKPGQWVHHMGASPFFHLGQKYLACQPGFILDIVKEPEISVEKMYEVWEKRGQLDEAQTAKNVIALRPTVCEGD